MEILRDIGRVDFDELLESEYMKSFFMHAFSDQIFETPSHLVDITKNIVDVCGGLPLSLKVVGGTLPGFNTTHMGTNFAKTSKGKIFGIKKSQ